MPWNWSLPSEYSGLAPWKKVFPQSHFEGMGYLGDFQHGWRGHSCLTQLLNHINIVILNFINNKDTDCIYLDYAKVYDKVDHRILLEKIQAIRISGRLGSWLESFLLDPNKSR